MYTLFKNSYHKNDWDCRLSRPRKQKEKNPSDPYFRILTLDFISHSHSRKIKKTDKKYKFDIQLNSNPARKLKDCFKKIKKKLKT